MPEVVRTTGDNEGCRVEYLDTPVTSENDKKEYKVIKLPNGLTALLISDMHSKSSGKENDDDDDEDEESTEDETEDEDSNEEDEDDEDDENDVSDEYDEEDTSLKRVRRDEKKV